jgi:thiamine biosynthesis protein ThiI
MMKRGVEVLPLFMDQRPFVGENYVERATKVVTTLGDFIPSGIFGLYTAPFGDIMTRISEAEIPSLKCVLCKRSMYRVAENFAYEKKAKGIITGESLGQVASQTLDNLYILDSAVNIPVLRPLIGLDKVEIERFGRTIGTYDITAVSVDGCTVVPRRPTTRANIAQVLKMEEELNLRELCSEVVRKISFTEIDLE